MGKIIKVKEVGPTTMMTIILVILEVPWVLGPWDQIKVKFNILHLFKNYFCVK